MTAGGWVFLVSSTIAVWGLCAWCYYKVLSTPGHSTKPPDSLGG